MGMSSSRSFILNSGRATGVRGLWNFGLSCCINALLQTFSATTELLELLKRWQPSAEFEDPHNVPLQLKRVLHAMRDQLQPAPHHDFIICLHHSYISCHTQHDADELFHAILNLTQQQMLDRSMAAEIQNLYKITMEGQIQCSECTYMHSVPGFFLSLPLHLPENKSTLVDCIRSFFEVQELENSEMFYCDRCDEKQPTSQGFKIVSLPPILCILLKRFRSFHGFTRKLYCEVSFPESLSVADIVREENPDQVMRERNYELYAVVVHVGSPTFGHYTAYVRSMQNQTWYFIDDSRVNQARWEDVQQTYGGSRGAGTAYMLLYRRCSSETVEGAIGGS